jgi:hypothetical protein
MPSKKPLRDRTSDQRAIVSALKGNKDKVFGCAGTEGLFGRSGVPKSLVRGVIEGHPGVEIFKDPKQTGRPFRFKYRETEPATPSTIMEPG